jgi:hypothetical protein
VFKCSHSGTFIIGSPEKQERKSVLNKLEMVGVNSQELTCPKNVCCSRVLDAEDTALVLRNGPHLHVCREPFCNFSSSLYVHLGDVENESTLMTIT